MDDFRASATELQQSLLTWVLGFFGMLAAFKLLPKTIKYVLRRYVFGLVSEIVFVVIAALLTEKAAEKLTNQRTNEMSHERSPHEMP